MAEPITVPIETDPDELAAIAFDYMEAAIPGWSRARGDADSQLIAAVAQIIAEGTGAASDVPLAILRYLGRWVDGLLPIDATSAQTTATVTALDALGYTIEDGARFEIRTSGDAGQVFLSVGTVTIAPGDTATLTGEVVLIAETPGAAGSGLSAASEVVPVDALAWVDTVTLAALTTGGVDAEPDDQYLARWILLRELSHDSPVRAADSARLLLALIPGIGRALPLDLYDPVAGTFGNEKYVTVAVADITGEPVSGALKTAATALLASKRLIGSVAPVIDPNYSTISVTVAFTTHPGFDVTSAQAAVVFALAAYLSPATWGTPQGADATSWVAKAFVRYLEIAAVVNGVEPVDEITALSFGRVLMVTGVAATDVLTATGHGYVLDDPVVFPTLTGGAGLVAGTTYYARTITTNTFQVAAAPAGAAINFTTDISAATVRSLRTSDVPLVGVAPLTRPGVLVAVGTAP